MMNPRHLRLLAIGGLLLILACTGRDELREGEFSHVLAEDHDRENHVDGSLNEVAVTPDSAAVQDKLPPAQRFHRADQPATAINAERPRKSAKDVRKIIRGITSLQLGIVEGKLRDDVALSEPPYAADELDLVELIMELEEEFDVLIEERHTTAEDGGFKPFSVNDLVRIISSLTTHDIANGTAAETIGGTATKLTPDRPQAESSRSRAEINTDLPRPTAPYRRLEATKVNDVTVVAFVDQVLRDDLDVYQLGQELERLVEGRQSAKLLLDLRAVETLSAAGLGKLLMFQKRVEARDGQIKLCNLKPDISRLFKVTRLDQVFEIHRSSADGLRAFQERERKVTMPSHFSTIGFVGDTAEELLALANRVASESDEMEVSDGKYLRWSSSCGAEVWLQLDRDNKLIGVVPHFTGGSRVRVGITARVTRPNETLLDGAFHGYANPADSSPASGDYPFVFDLPDYHRHDDLTIPSITTVQIAAFAHEVSLFDSVASYEASQLSEPPLASKSFIPSGLFDPGGKSIEPPEAFAILSGHILKSARKVNDLSGQAFYWALVESYGGTFDVVIHEELVSEAPRIGGVVTGSFWLSGRIRTSPSASASQGQR